MIIYSRIYIYNFFVLIFCFSNYLNINSIKIDRVIVATNANADYIEFWPIVAKAWKEVVGIKPTLALIADDSVIVDETIGDVIRFKPIDNIPTSFQAQIIRHLLPIYFEDEVSIISDIDMLPMNKYYFTESVKDVPEDNFIVYRDKAYLYYERKAEWIRDFPDYPGLPMCYCAAKGKVFKDVFDIKSTEDIESKIIEWYNTFYAQWGWSTDEFVLYNSIRFWKKRSTNYTGLGHATIGRIDRWYNLDYNFDLLKQHQYTDMHCPRPYSNYKKEIDEILDFYLRS